MPKGVRHGGRQKGTPNKSKAPLYDKVLELGFDPVESMAIIGKQAMEDGDNALALSAAKELAQYVAPKRKAIEHSGSDGEAIKHDLSFNVKGV